MPLFLNSDRTIQVPDVHHPEQAGYYVFDAVPGDVGAAVLLGHVDGDGRLGVFHDINKLNLGDVITVDRSDGQTVSFKVYRVTTVSKTNFPSAAFYESSGAELHLATCGGPFDPMAKSYKDSVLIFAKKG